jgi:hypothetical protein
MTATLFELRPKLLRQPFILIGIPVVGGLGTFGILDHQVIGGVLFIVAFVFVSYVSLARVRITVTADQVAVADVFGAAAHNRAPRSAIASIHVYSFYVVLSGRDGRKVLSSNPYWTRDQLLDLSEALGVPLVNHRTFGGWGRSTPGTVVTRSPVPDRSTEQEGRAGGGLGGR